jgi:RNA polymerase sigma-70 factor (ECF subfamily)
VRIAVNRAIDLVRARRRYGLEDELPELFVFDPPLADESLHGALGRLAPERRAVIALHYWLDFTLPEIAQVLDLPVGTVNSRLARALRDLRCDLEVPNV